MEKLCPCCGINNQGKFPAGVTELVQYGSQVRALAVYLMNQQLLPYGRTAQMFLDLFSRSISKGTLHSMQQECFNNLESVVEGNIKQAATDSKLAHFDETGVRCEKQNHWMHVAAGTLFTYYAISKYRGQKAINEIGILPNFKGIAVHDCWEAYFLYPLCTHALCNAHLLRELTFIDEQEKEPWARRMKALLMAIHAKVELWRSNERAHLGEGSLENFEAEYSRIVTTGFHYHRRKGQLASSGSRGRKKQRAGKNLLDRLHKHHAFVLRFMHDFNVPFTNNLGERDLRMQKVKAKISGCFRTWRGAEMFCRIRSYLSTARKQRWNILQAIHQAVIGTPMLPSPRTTWCT